MDYIDKGKLDYNVRITLDVIKALGFYTLDTCKSQGDTRITSAEDKLLNWLIKVNCNNADVKYAVTQLKNCSPNELARNLSMLNLSATPVRLVYMGLYELLNIPDCRISVTSFYAVVELFISEYACFYGLDPSNLLLNFKKTAGSLEGRRKGLLILANEYAVLDRQMSAYNSKY